MRRLYGDLGLTDAAHREDSFAPAFDPEIVRPQWIDGERFWYVYREAADSRLVIVDAASSKRNTVWLKHLAAAAQAQGGGAATVRVTHVDADANIVFSHGERSWRFDPRTGRADPMVVGSAARRPGLTDAVAIPDGSGWLGLEDYNLWIEASDGKKQALSRDGELWRDFCAAYGMPDSRLPMHECLGWFAGGRRFWIERWDNRQVGEA
ncbi:MAG: hypothetical protein JNL55_02335, partial [Steroidobacter sp.]|nr:hypothetical protein [Steroidobacter sp.]